MHLCHPTKSLVSSLHASQRVSRRSGTLNGAAGQDSSELGWTPGAARADPRGWVPPGARNGRD